MIVGERARQAGEHVPVAYRAPFDVDRADFGENEVRAPQLRANRRDDVPHLEFARGHLGQHRREERIVVARQQDDLGFVRATSVVRVSARRRFLRTRRRRSLLQARPTRAA